jgi:hypothetical protein
MFITTFGLFVKIGSHYFCPGCLLSPLPSSWDVSDHILIYNVRDIGLLDSSLLICKSSDLYVLIMWLIIWTWNGKFYLQLQ